jgi:2-methylcitrate dehydratase PrpD
VPEDGDPSRCLEKNVAAHRPEDSDATRRLAGWVARTTFADIPARVVEEAKSQILSVLGAVHAGAATDAGRAIVATVGEWPGRPEATLIPSGVRSSVYNAVYANAALSMALDYDDYLFAGHTGHSAVLASLALAEKLGRGGRDLLTAQIVANEVEGRVGASVLFGPQNGQLWTFIHLVGGAVSTAKLAGLDAATTRSAIGIALLQPPYGLWAGFFGSEAKALMASGPTTAGIQAADLAAHGLGGSPDIIEHPQGFVQAFAHAPLLGAYSGLGTTWLTETLCYKLYPGCAYLDTAIDCVLALARAERIDPARVTAIEIAAGPLTLGMEALSAGHVKGPASTPVTLNFSLPYSTAVALIDRELTPRQFTRARIGDPAVWALAAKVHVTFDEEFAARTRASSLVRMGDDARPHLDLAAADLAGHRMSFGARVRVTCDDGRILEEAEEVPRGGWGRPPEEKRRAAEEKFLREATPGVGRARAAEAVTMVAALDEADPAALSRLVALVCRPS